MCIEFSWSERTTRTRNFQWKAWIQICASDGRVPLLVTEAHLMTFLGWIRNEREYNRRIISRRLISNYRSALRQMNTMVAVEPLHSFTYADLFIRDLKRWEEHVITQEEIQCGI